ncbi:MAG: aspartate-semialdehyde dehydrogenase [Alphaproteobacteria bacterium]|nr:aspartate-semialdehyde dehydrogenase [Alphaproteobacteria bacterium]
MSHTIAVVGATGAVGKEILEVLEQREFPIKEIHAVASSRSAGTAVPFAGDEVTVEDLDKFDFTGIDLALFSPGAGVSKIHAPRAASAGCVVIDNTSHFRMDEDVPLVVPEVNPQALAGYTARNIIANPNCSTIEMVVALKPLHDLARIRRVSVATYQAAGGAGQAGMDELFEQTRAVFANEPIVKTKFTKQIAFNVIPHIDAFLDDGATKEEWKMAVETKKILDPAIDVFATCVRVPVFIGHGLAVHAEFEEPIDEAAAREALRAAPGISVVDHRADEGYVTPLECAGDDPVFVSRIRKDPTIENGLGFWVAADNLRKGAALNAVQIAEVLVESYLQKAA